jgi:hypothetical protein
MMDSAVFLTIMPRRRPSEEPKRNGTHNAVTQLLLHFQCQRRAIHLERVIHLGHLVAWEIPRQPRRQYTEQFFPERLRSHLLEPLRLLQK